MLLGPILIPWYVIWGLPLVWALPRVPRTTMLAASSMLGVTLWSAEALRYPGAFELNLLVGYLIVVPVLVVLLVLVVGDLRRAGRSGARIPSHRRCRRPGRRPTPGRDRRRGALARARRASGAPIRT